jgi:hypothetical protein
MRIPLLLVTGLACALAVGGCAVPMTASAHLDREQNFSAYRTFAWTPADILPAGDPRLDGDPFFIDHLQGAIEKQLRARGLALVDAEAADVLVHYHASISQRIDAVSIDREYGACSSPECVTETRYYDAGTIILDVVDRRAQKVVWRGWAQTEIGQALHDRARLAAIIDKAAARIVGRFPRAGEFPAAATSR